ncbi:MAG: hypothetical protein ACI9OU_000485 [Candidatus Promineifilaceae bacterium]|jgi:hypothetical protein
MNAPAHFTVTLICTGLVAMAAHAAEQPSPIAALGLHGFADTRVGMRTQHDANQDDVSLAEARLQLDAQRYVGPVSAQFRADFLYDDMINGQPLDIEQGKGWIDLREANLQFSPMAMMDVKMGRQILTWGTGDLLFINDLFPKDYQAFFIGRDEQYLKAPSDAIITSVFHEWVNVDLVYTPRFDADRFISGERISFYSPLAGARVGQHDPVHAERPDDWLQDDEVALRLSRNLSGYEWALYAYHGYWKSPRGYNSDTGKATFPPMRSAGASMRGQMADGIGNVEVAYFDSIDDPNGDDPAVPNSEARLLLGYEREVVQNLTGSAQYYVEQLQDYAALRSTLPTGQRAGDETRHVVTLRLTKMLLSQNLALSLFTFYSPSDEDAFIRPRATYKATDNWSITAGGNVFLGEHEHTFFGQFEDNSNLYVGARYSF